MSILFALLSLASTLLLCLAFVYVGRSINVLARRLARAEASLGLHLTALATLAEQTGSALPFVHVGAARDLQDPRADSG